MLEVDVCVGSVNVADAHPVVEETVQLIVPTQEGIVLGPHGVADLVPLILLTWTFICRVEPAKT